MKRGYIDFATLSAEKWLPVFEPLLSPTQRNRAAQFKTKALRDFYMMRQGITLLVLANHLVISPKAVKLNYNEYQKPLLANKPSVYFNTSSTLNRHFMITTSEHGPCGVDIQAIEAHSVSNLLDSEAITLAESTALKRLPKAQQITAFYNTWVRKEAYLKAIGQGFYQSPKEIALPIIETPPETWPSSNRPYSFAGFDLHLTLIEPNLPACLAGTAGDSISPKPLNIEAIMNEPDFQIE